MPPEPIGSVDATDPAAPSGPSVPQPESSTQRFGAGLRGRWWLEVALPPVAFLVLAITWTWPVFGNPTGRLTGSSDGILFSWYFEWVARSVTHGHNPLISGALNAPHGVNVMWNTAVLALSVLCIPLTLSIGAVGTVSLLMVLSPAISASVAYWVLRRLTGGWIGAAIGATLYGFGPFTIGQFGHLHLLFAPFPPLLVLLGHRLLVTQPGRPTRTGVLLGLLVGVELLVSEEIVALCATAAAVALAWLALVNRDRVRDRTRYAVHALAVGVGVTAVIVAVPLYYQFLGTGALSGFTTQTMRADVASLVRPSVLVAYASRDSIRANFHYPANGAENTGYLGWPLIIATVCVCAWFILRRDRVVTWWALTTISVIVFEFGSPISLNGRAIGHGPWAVVRQLPLMGGVIPNRFSLLVLLLIGGLIAWTLARLRGRALAAGVAIAALVLVPLRPNLPLRSGPVPPTPRFFTTSAVEAIPPGAVTIVLPQAGFPRAQAMLWQVRAHLRFALVGGYGVFEKDGKATYFPQLPGFEQALRQVGFTGRIDAAGLARLRGTDATTGVRYVVITREQPHADEVARASALVTGCTPRPVADVVLCAIPAD